VKKTFRHNDFTAVFSDEGTGPENRYFSFTGEMDGGGGACGDAIVKIYPAFTILNDLHLATLDGEPMHALENGFYHFVDNNFDTLRLAKYWAVTFSDEQRKRINKSVPECFTLGLWPELSRKEQHDSSATCKEIITKIMEEIRPQWKAKVEEARKLIASTPSDLTEIDETISLEDFDEPGKVRALAAWLDVHFSIIEEQNDRYNEGYYTVEGITYQVLTDDEADEAQDQDLDSYLEECVFPDLPTNMVQYFDRDAWKEDAKMDGRGHSLGRYDGDEHEITDPESGEIFFAYR
jgi:hypothetical protein